MMTMKTMLKAIIDNQAAVTLVKCAAIALSVI